MIAERKHNRLPVVEHGRLVGVVTRVDVLERADRGRKPCRCGRWPGSTSARSSATARGWPRWRRRPAVRGRQGRRLRPRGGRRRRARRRRGGATLARGRDGGGGGASCARRASTGRVLVMGALVARGARRSRSPRGADVVAWREEFVARRCRRRDVARARQARHRHGPARHARPGRGDARSPRRRRRDRPAARGRDDALRDRRRRPGVHARAARALPPWADALRPRTPDCSSTPPTRPRRCASRPRGCDLVRCGIAIYGMDPFQRDPAEHGLEPALELRLLRRRGQARARRARARATAAASSPSATTWLGDDPDRLRRRRAPRRSPTTPTCSSAAAACRSSARSRWTTSPSTSATASRSSAAPRPC